MLNAVAILAGLLAAVFWAWSAHLRIPTFINTDNFGDGSLLQLLRKQGCLSAIAAGFTAASVAAQAVSLYLKAN